MDLYTWISINGWLPVLLGMIGTFLIGYFMAKNSRKKAKQEFMEATPQIIEAFREEILPYIPTLDELTEELEKKLPGLIMKSLGGQGTQLVNEISKTNEFQDLVNSLNDNAIDITPDMLNGEIPNLSQKQTAVIGYGQKLMDIVIKGVGNKIVKKIDKIDIF